MEKHVHIHSRCSHYYANRIPSVYVYIALRALFDLCNAAAAHSFPGIFGANYYFCEPRRARAFNADTGIKIRALFGLY